MQAESSMILVTVLKRVRVETCHTFGLAEVVVYHLIFLSSMPSSSCLIYHTRNCCGLENTVLWPEWKWKAEEESHRQLHWLALVRVQGSAGREMQGNMKLFFS